MVTVRTTAGANSKRPTRTTRFQQIRNSTTVNNWIIKSINGENDNDGDGIPDELDNDDDNDGIPDITDS